MSCRGSRDISRYFRNSKRFLDYTRNDRSINKRFNMEKVTIRIPASTSNLGPGFDCLGVALRIYNLVAVSRSTKREPLAPIVAKAADLFFNRTKRGRFAFSCSAAEKIPRSRGLGSSATIRLGAFVDQLHQPFRARLISFLPRVMAAAESAGALGAFLSGSGSTICAVTLHDPRRVAAAMQRAAGSTSTEIAITSADNRGVQIRNSWGARFKY